MLVMPTEELAEVFEVIEGAWVLTVDILRMKLLSTVVQPHELLSPSVHR